MRIKEKVCTVLSVIAIDGTCTNLSILAKKYFEAEKDFDSVALLKQELNKIKKNT